MNSIAIAHFLTILPYGLLDEDRRGLSLGCYLQFDACEMTRR